MTIDTYEIFYSILTDIGRTGHVWHIDNDDRLMSRGIYLVRNINKKEV